MTLLLSYKCGEPEDEEWSQRFDTLRKPFVEVEMLATPSKKQQGVLQHLHAYSIEANTADLEPEAKSEPRLTTETSNINPTAATHVKNPFSAHDVSLPAKPT